MKTLPKPDRVAGQLLLAGVMILTASIAEARPYYGVSTSQGYAVRGPRGGAVVGEDRSAVVTRRGFAATGPEGSIVARRPYSRHLPAGYIRTIPAGYRTVSYGGYKCYYVGGVYYRPVVYQGTTVYVVVR